MSRGTHGRKPEIINEGIPQLRRISSQYVINLGKMFLLSNGIGLRVVFPSVSAIKELILGGNDVGHLPLLDRPWLSSFSRNYGHRFKQ